MGAIDIRLAKIELAAFLEIFGQAAQRTVQRAVLDPSLEAAMARLVRRVPSWHVGPRSARAQHPEHSIHNVAWVPPWTAAALTGALQLFRREVRLDFLTLFVGQIH